MWKELTEVELGDVHEVDPHQLVALHPDRPVVVGERHRVHRVDLVRGVEVGVEAVHHHHQLVGLRAAVLRVDHERAVEALGDVLGQRAGVAVVEVQAERPRLELVREALARRDVARRRPPGCRRGGRCGCRGSASCAGGRSRSRTSPARGRPRWPAAWGPARGRCRSRRRTSRPGATSISRSSATISKVRTVRPPSRVTVPRSKSRRISVGSNPFTRGIHAADGAPLRAPRVRRRGAARRSARRARPCPRPRELVVHDLVGDRLVQERQRGRGAGCGPEQFPARDFGRLRHLPCPSLTAKLDGAKPRKPNGEGGAPPRRAKQY